jgi:hypothetical protein
MLLLAHFLWGVTLGGSSLLGVGRSSSARWGVGLSSRLPEGALGGIEGELVA